MDSPGGMYGGDSPARPLAGPSRSRRELRQRRSTLAKPYGRPSVGAAPSSAALDSPTASPATAAVLARQRRQSNVVDVTTSPVASLRRRQSNASLASQSAQQASGGGGGILSSLRDALFSRPFAWLQRGAPRSDVLPTASEPATTLPLSRSRRTSGTLTASSSFAAPAPPTASTFALGRSATTKPLPSSNSAWTSLGQPSNLDTPRPGQVYNVGLGQSRFGAPAVGATRASTSQPRSPSPARSSASAAIAAHGRQRLAVEPGVGKTLGDTGSILSTPGYRRTHARGAPSVADHGSTSALSGQSSTSFAYGFGSERRLAGISNMSSATPMVPTPSRLTASASYGRLPSRSPFAMQRTSGRSSVAGSDVGTGLRSPLRPATVYGGEGNRSRAGSNAGSATSSRLGTPRRREWSSLKLAPPTAQPSEGERLMQEYMTMRQGQGEGSASGTLPAALRERDFADTTGSVGPIMDFDMMSQVGSLKRELSMSVDGRDAAMSDATSRKRQMLWDPELGFVSRQDLRAAQPPRPVAQNEAERLLNALEGMKSPAGDARRGGAARSGTPSKSLATIKVPLHVSARSDLDIDAGSLRSRNRQLAKTVSPYSRAMRQNRLAQSAEPERSGMRSRLQRPAASSKLRDQHDDAMSVGSSRGRTQATDEEDNDVSVQDASEYDDEDQSSDEDAMEDEDDDDIIEPPRRKVASKVPQKPTPKPSSREEPKAEGRTLRSGKVLPPSPPKPQAHFSPQKEHKEHKDAAKPMSRARISLATNGASSSSSRERVEHAQVKPLPKAVASATSKDAFKVGGSGASQDASKGRSSLRQGAEKTSRSHVKSGRIGLDDDGDDGNEEDEGPSAAELDKIKLPANLFPSGFAFASSNTSSAKSSSPSGGPVLDAKASSNSSNKSSAQPSEPAAATSGGSSLFDRLGGFAPQTSETPPSKPEPSKPTFTFTAPSSTSSSTSSQQGSTAAVQKPAISFQPAVSSPLAAAPTESSASSSSSGSGFFAAPPAKVDAPSDNVRKHDGPVPNFFASTLSNSSADKPASISKETHKPASTPSFNFSAPASNTAPASMPSFSFSKPVSDSQPPASSKQPAFSFGAPAPSASSSDKPETSTKPTLPTASFGGFGASSMGSNGAFPSSADQSQTNTDQAGKSASQPSPFTFGAPAAPASDNPSAKPPAFGGFGQTSASGTGASTKKRGMDDSDDSNGDAHAHKKGPSVSFTAPASSPATSSGFNFGAPKPAASESKSQFSFGAPSTSSAQQSGTASAATGTPAFGGFGASQPAAPAASKPFAFGAPPATSSAAPATTQPGSGFSFGAAKPNGQTQGGFSFGSAPAANATTSNTPFGQPSQPSSAPAFGASNTSNAAPGGGFGSGGFGSQGSSRQASPAPFSFGAPSAQPTTPGASGFGSGGFGQSQAGQSAQSSGGFSFGAPSQPSQQPAATNSAGNAGSGFNFAMPLSGASGGFGGAGGFGQGAAPSPSAGASSSPFVFGAPSSTPASGINGMASSVAGGGFTFGSPAGSPAPGATDMSRGGGGSSSGGGSLFNIGAPSNSANNSPASGSRVVRGMPARRRRN